MVVEPESDKRSRAYVVEQASKGLAYVRDLIAADRDSVLDAIDGLTDEEGSRVTLEGEWTPVQVLAHLSRTLPRSLDRLKVLSSGRPWENPPPMGEPDADRPLAELRREYSERMQSILDELDRAREDVGRDIKVAHPYLGDFDWLEWAVYSHHVHTSDHIGQLNEARARVKAGA